MSIDIDSHYICQQGIRVAVLWKDLNAVTNKSILSSIKRYSKKTRDDMEAISGKYDLRFLLGILNSSFIARLYSDIRGGDYHIVPEHIRQVPIPDIDKDGQQSIIEIVDKILAQKRINSNADIIDLKQQVDTLVEALYARK